MKDGTASRATTHQVAAILLQLRNIALGVWVLILPDDHCAAVLPQIHGDIAVGGLRQQVVFNRNIDIGVGLGGDNQFRHRLIQSKRKIYVIGCLRQVVAVAGKDKVELLSADTEADREAREV